MLEVTGNLWDYHNMGEWVVITTNGFVKGNHTAVMGRGTAFQAAKKFPALPKLLGDKIEAGGNKVYTFSQYRIITLPVKHNWWQEADPELIIESIRGLMTITAKVAVGRNIYMPRPGCGNGSLSWDFVRPLCVDLSDRFVVVEIRP